MALRSLPSQALGRAAAGDPHAALGRTPEPAARVGRQGRRTTAAAGGGLVLGRCGGFPNWGYPNGRIVFRKNHRKIEVFLGVSLF